MRIMRCLTGGKGEWKGKKEILRQMFSMIHYLKEKIVKNLVCMHL